MIRVVHEAGLSGDCQCLSESFLAAGGSIEAIAEAKAGIMKPKKTVVLGHQPEPAAREVLEQKAAKLHCPVYNAESTVRLHNKGLHTAGDQLRQMVSVERLGVPPEGPLAGEASSQQFGELILHDQDSFCLIRIQHHLKEGSSYL